MEEVILHPSFTDKGRILWQATSFLSLIWLGNPVKIEEGEGISRWSKFDSF